MVTADRDRVMQVLLNLLSNAAKFCDPRNGRVGITLTRLADCLQNLPAARAIEAAERMLAGQGGAHITIAS